MDEILKHSKFVAPVDVLIGTGMLKREHLEDWRHGRIPYLEQSVDGNLTRLSRLLRILRFHAHDLNLTPSWTAYMKWGKGPKARLRFTKTSDPGLEKVYATHFVWPVSDRFMHLLGRSRIRCPQWIEGAKSVEIGAAMYT